MKETVGLQLSLLIVAISHLGYRMNECIKTLSGPV
jgi:hypothetical protein